MGREGELWLIYKMNKKYFEKDLKSFNPTVSRSMSLGFSEGE